MTTENHNPFKELESSREDLLPDETKDQVIETVNSVHQVLEFIGEGILLPAQALITTLLFFLGDDS